MKGGRMADSAFAVLWSGQVAIVRLPAEVDLTLADGLRDTLLSVLNRGAAGLVVDMTVTSFCDSAGISALARAARRASASEAWIAVAVTAPAVLRVLSLTGLVPHVAVYPGVRAALAALPGSRRPLTPPDPDAAAPGTA